MTEWQGFGRREVKEGWSRARMEGPTMGDAYLLAFLGFVVAFAGFLCAWSGIVQQPDRYGGGWGFFGLALVALGIFLWRPLYLRHWAPRPPRPSEPLAPWQADHPWDPSGIGSDADRPRWVAFGWLVGGTLFALAFVVPPDWFFRALGLFFVSILLRGWWRALRFVLHRAKFGPSRLRFVRCPYRLGEEMKVYLEDLDRLRGARQIRIVLRYIVEELEWRRAGKGTKWVSVRYARFEEERRLPPAEIAFGGGEPARVFRLARQLSAGSELPLYFHLPANEEMETRLTRKKPQYWEVDVRADLPGLDYWAVFLVPVYGRAPVPPARPAGG